MKRFPKSLRSEIVRVFGTTVGRARPTCNLVQLLARRDALSQSCTAVIGIEAEPDTVRTGLAVLIALLIELGSGLGPWLASPTTKRKGVAGPITKIERVIVDPPSVPAIEPAADDVVARWAAAALVKRRGSFVTAKEARAAFEAWCATEGVATLNATALGKQMTALGYERNKVGRAIRYEGVALVPTQPMPLRLAVSNAPSVLGRMATVGRAK